MGLQARGYRLADWFDIRPYNPSYGGFLSEEGTKPGFEEAYDILVKSFAPVAVFDKDYDALGAFPTPPVLRRGQPVSRTLIVYNDAFSGEDVTVSSSACRRAGPWPARRRRCRSGWATTHFWRSRSRRRPRGRSNSS